MSGKTRKILVRIAVLGVTLWAGHDAVHSLKSSGGIEGSRIAMRIAVVLHHLKGETSPSRGLDGDASTGFENSIVLSSPKRPGSGAGLPAPAGVELRATADETPPLRAVDVRGGMALCSPPNRAPPAV